MFEQIVPFPDKMPLLLYYAFAQKPSNSGEQLYRMHMHKEYELLLITHGTICCKTLDAEYIAEDGDILFINSNTPHSTYDVYGGESHILLQFNSPKPADSALHYLHRFLRENDTPVSIIKKDTYLARMITNHFGTLCTELGDKNPHWQDIINSTLIILIATLRRHGIISEMSQPTSSNLEKIKPAIDYINQNYFCEFSTAHLAEMLNFNEIYFCRLFKSAVGTTLIDYLNFVRICKAEQLLETDKSISDIAYETGFSSLSYFNRVFKKYKGLSPREHRKFLLYSQS